MNLGVKTIAGAQFCKVGGKVCSEKTRELDEDNGVMTRQKITVSLIWEDCVFG